MIKEILYSFNKLDYFRYFFLFILLVIIIKNKNIVNSDNIISLIVAGIILYFFINKKILNDFSKMENINKDLIILNIDKYKNIGQDIDVINYLVKLQSLIKTNRIKFNSFMKHVDNFFYCFKISNNKNERPSTIYEIALDESKNALNILTSFYINIEVYPNLNKDREYRSRRIITDKVDLDECINKFQMIFSKYLNEMEYDINSEWLKGNINNYSKPIYPDEPDSSVFNNKFYDDKYDLY
jgi:hypothetical protein